VPKLRIDGKGHGTHNNCAVGQKMPAFIAQDGGGGSSGDGFSGVDPRGERRAQHRHRW